MTTPNECRDINQIRTGIDEIERNLITLLGERAVYVREAAKFKKNADEVRAAERVEQMLKTRRTWAYCSNISPDFIEGVYRQVIAYFVKREMEAHRNEQDKILLKR